MLEAISHRKKFGTELFLQLIYLLGQCLGLLAVLFAVELRNEIKDLAIGPGLCLVTTDDADEISRVGQRAQRMMLKLANDYNKLADRAEDRAARDMSGPSPIPKG